MSKLKNPTLRNRTEELCEHANNFEETLQIGYELKNTCYQCGKCGRVFENGFMVDDGGTTIEEEEQE